MNRKQKFAALLSFMLIASNAYAVDYAIDESHSSANFAIRHMMVSNVRGQFSNIKGTVTYDPANPASSKVEATLDSATINTQNQKRDDHLKSPDFFDVAKFPSIKYVSKKVEQVSPGKLKVTGDLSIHGVTKEVVLDVDGPTDEVMDMQGKPRRGATASAKLNRKDFGLTWNKVLEAGGVAVGEEVTITIDLELIKKS